MKKLIVLLLMILPLGAIAQEVKIAFVKTQEVFMAMPEVSGMEKQMAEVVFIMSRALLRMKRLLQSLYIRLAASWWQNAKNSRAFRRL